MRHGIVGMGRVGHVVASLLAELGEDVCGLQSTHSLKREHPPVPLYETIDALMASSPDLLWITVPDSRIASVIQDIQKRWNTAKLHVVHCSGVTRCDALLEELKPLRGLAGAHPLQAFSGGTEDVELARRAHWYLGGSAETTQLLKSLLKGSSIQIQSIRDEERERYHAAAVLISNGLVALASLCEMLMPEGRVASLIPLTQGTLDNLASTSPREAMTGPVHRGDSSTLERHLDCLAEIPHAKNVYRELSSVLIALRSAGMAETTSLERQISESLRQALDSSSD